MKAVRSLIYVIFGIVLASMGIHSFLLPNHFIDGGVTGVSMLVADVAQIELSLIILLINIPFVIVGSLQINWRFALRSSLAILGLAVVMHLVHFPVLTQDKILSAIFGGLALGAGIGLAFRGGAVLDGTEILAILLSRRLGLTVGDIILVFNLFIFTLGALFLGLDRALYSVLTYLSASKAIDFLVYGFELLGVHIVSKSHVEIKEAITQDLGLGVTMIRGQTGVGAYDQDIIFCVCSRFDVPKVKALVSEKDAQAFVTLHKIVETSGGVMKSFDFQIGRAHV